MLYCSICGERTTQELNGIPICKVCEWQYQDSKPWLNRIPDGRGWDF